MTRPIGVLALGVVGLFTLYALTKSPQGDLLPMSLKFRGTVKTTSTSLNVRRGPGTNHTAVAALENGTRLKICGSAANGWLRIVSDEVRGYVSAKYVQKGLVRLPSFGCTE
jgi:uncharacterized protein YgiM (DUF1202 family)